MGDKDLWNGITSAKITVPKNHLAEQADSFNKSSVGSKMAMEVSSTIKDDLQNLESMLSGGSPVRIEIINEIRVTITVPELSGYSMQIMKVVHKVNSIYPCFIYDTLKDNSKMTCENSEQFVENVQKVLSSDEMKSALSNILAQLE